MRDFSMNHLNYKAQKIVVYCEDRNGVAFYKTLFNKLKVVKLIPKISIKISFEAADCNFSLDRKISQTIKSNEYVGILLINDADLPKKRQVINNHKPKDGSIKFESLLFKTELEEIIHDYHPDYTMNHDGPCIKPSKCLRDNKNYDKRTLSKLVGKLDTNKVRHHYLIKRFIKFCNSL